MAVIHGHIIDGASMSWSASGISFCEKHIVENVLGTTPTQKYRWVKNYLGIIPGLQHNEMTDCFLQDIKFDMLTPTTIQVVLTYEQMFNIPDEISISGSLANVQTNLDFEGTPITVSYTFPDDYELDTNKRGVTDPVNKLIDKQVPTLALAIKTREKATGSNLILRAKNYLGKLNEAGWNLVSDPEGRWIVKGIDPQKVGIVYQNGYWNYIFDTTYNFEWSDNWSVDVIYINPDNGDPVDATGENVDAKKTVQVYSTANFNNIQNAQFFVDNITIPDLGNIV